MIGLDTNILLRYFLEDSPAQTERVHSLFKRARQLPEPLFVSTMVLCELVWVLSNAYSKSKIDILAVLQMLLDGESFIVEYEDAVREAARAWRTGSGGFVDYLIGARNLAQGCRYTVTFDRALRSSVAFSVL